MFSAAVACGCTWGSGGSVEGRCLMDKDSYGIRVLRQGIEVRPDNRHRDVNGVPFVIPVRVSPFQERGEIKAFSRASARRLEFRAANTGVEFRSLITLTYRAVMEWESDEERNRAIVRRSKRDLNRWLSCLRKELGSYIWVQEFQERGVIHYHVVAEREMWEPRIQVAWCRVIGALGDSAALKYGAKVEAIRSPDGARQYLGKYVGKQRQKLLPPGVEGAGRWWGCSRNLRLVVLEEMVIGHKKSPEVWLMGVFVLRHGRRYLRRKLGFKFRSGCFVNWGGALAEGLAKVMQGLREWYMREMDRKLEALDLEGKWGWVAVEGGSDAESTRWSGGRTADEAVDRADVAGEQQGLFGGDDSPARRSIRRRIDRTIRRKRRIA